MYPLFTLVLSVLALVLVFLTFTMIVLGFMPTNVPCGWFKTLKVKMHKNYSRTGPIGSFTLDPYKKKKNDVHKQVPVRRNVTDWIKFLLLLATVFFFVWVCTYIAVARAEIDPTQMMINDCEVDEVIGFNLRTWYKGAHCNHEVAMKILKPPQPIDSDMETEPAQQIFITRKIRHRNVVQFIGACTKPPSLCIGTELEYVSGGSAYDCLHKIPKCTLPKLIDLLEKLWQQDQSLRTDFSEITEVLQQIAKKVGDEEMTVARRNQLEVSYHLASDETITEAEGRCGNAFD